MLLIAVLLVASCQPAAPAPAQAPKAAATTAPAAPAATAAPAAAKAPAPAAGAKSRFTSSANLQPPEALNGNPYPPPGIDAAISYV